MNRSSHRNYQNRMSSPDKSLCRMCSPDRCCYRILDKSLRRFLCSPDRCCCRYWSSQCSPDSRPRKCLCSSDSRPRKCRSNPDRSLGRFLYSPDRYQSKYPCSQHRSLGRSLCRFPYTHPCRFPCKCRSSRHRQNNSR